MTVLPSAARYLSDIAALMAEIAAWDADGRERDFDRAVSDAIAQVAGLADSGASLHLIGNGGSAAIASHMAIDFFNRGGIRTVNPPDAAALTCLGNDFGFDQVYARQIEGRFDPGDLLIAISSSGRSPDILNAVAAARGLSGTVITLSGFEAANPLSSMGDLNFHVPSDDYGPVELAHLAILTAILDLMNRRRPGGGAAAA